MNETETVEFVAEMPGFFTYYCDIPGHRLVGMFGTLRVEGEAVAGAGGHDMAAMPTPAPVAPANPDAVSIVRR